MFDICKECGKKRFIVNKKYHLCETCNKQRLELQSSNVQKNKNTSPSKPKLSKFHKIKPVSNKEKENKQKLIASYKKIDSTRSLICDGCGQSSLLSHSHLISQRNKSLQSDPENIVFHCMQREVPDQFGNEGCHSRWESGQWKKIITLQHHKKYLLYLKKKDPAKYQKIILSKE